MIKEWIPATVSKNQTHQDAMCNHYKKESRTKSNRVLQWSVIFGMMSDNVNFSTQFTDKSAFKKWLSKMVFCIAYNKNDKPLESDPIT